MFALLYGDDTILLDTILLDESQFKEKKASFFFGNGQPDWIVNVILLVTHKQSVTKKDYVDNSMYIIDKCTFLGLSLKYNGNLQQENAWCNKHNITVCSLAQIRNLNIPVHF